MRTRANEPLHCCKDALQSPKRAIHACDDRNLVIEGLRHCYDMTVEHCRDWSVDIIARM